MSSADFIPASVAARSDEFGFLQGKPCLHLALITPQSNQSHPLRNDEYKYQNRLEVSILRDRPKDPKNLLTDHLSPCHIPHFAPCGMFELTERCRADAHADLRSSRTAETKASATTQPVFRKQADKAELHDENPSLHDEQSGPSTEQSETLPPLTGSTNPLFPNAVIKKPTNTHSKGYAASHRAAAAGSEHAEDDASAQKSSVTGSNGVSLCISFARFKLIR